MLGFAGKACKVGQASNAGNVGKASFAGSAGSVCNLDCSSSLPYASPSYHLPQPLIPKVRYDRMANHSMR